MQPLFKEWVYASPPLGQSVYISYLKFYCLKDLYFLLHVIVFNNLYQYEFIDIYFIIWVTFDYNPILLYFVGEIVPALATGSSFSCLLCLFDTPTSS